MRIAEAAEFQLASIQRSLDARLAEARAALARAAAAPPGAAPPAVAMPDVVTLSPEARAAYQQILREPPDLATLAGLVREELRARPEQRGPYLAALRAALMAAGAGPAAIPPAHADLSRLAPALRAAFPAIAGDQAAVAAVAAWLLAGRAGPGFELPPALLSLLVEWRERRRTPGRRSEPRRPSRQR